MLAFCPFLQIFELCCLEFINFYDIPLDKRCITAPLLNTHVFNLTSSQSLSLVVNSRRGICNTCTAELFNLDAIITTFPNLVDFIISSPTKTHLGFRIFVYSRSSQNPSSLHTIPQSIRGISTTQNLFVEIKNSALDIHRVYSLTSSRFVQLFSTSTCNTSELQQTLILRRPINRDLSNQYVSLPEYITAGGTFWGGLELIRRSHVQYCSDTPSGYRLGTGEFFALPTKVCVLFHFILETNVSVFLTDLERWDKLIPVQNLKLNDISGRKIKTNWIDIHPHAETHDGLFYSVFINKSELGINLNLMKPFNTYVWITFVSTGVLLSVALWALLEEKWTHLFSIIFFIFSISLLQTNKIFQNSLRRKIKVGSLIIVTWSTMMIVLTYSYSNLIYSVLMTTVKPSLPNNLPELLKIVGIKVYTFQRPKDQYGIFTTRVDELIERVDQFTVDGKKIVETVKSVDDRSVFDKTILSLAYHGFVDSTRISQKFIALQNSGNLRTFTTLLVETGRFVVLNNDDHHLVNFRSVWISTRNRVGQVFGNFLGCLHESGIYSFWARRWQRYVDAAGVRAIRQGNKKYNGGHSEVHSSKKNKPISSKHLAMLFSMLRIGLVAAWFVHIVESGWFIGSSLMKNRQTILCPCGTYWNT
ncbi:hypothetical protein Fcan01_17231 [Folsomia candida]|uniref:Uncharacterized protein n=1 Tax=Folsomia candida TaxID=158441 RepID=A0A226DQH3_FOLCA|nr:hypothetical protein Fcan01_17231 [Folsomia candida]